MNQHAYISFLSSCPAAQVAARAAVVVPASDEGAGALSEIRSTDSKCSHTGMQVTGARSSGAVCSDARIRTGEAAFFAYDIASISYDIRFMSYVKAFMSYDIRSMSYVQASMSYVIRPMSYVKASMSYDIVFKSYVKALMSYDMRSMSYVEASMSYDIISMSYVKASMSYVKDFKTYVKTGGKPGFVARKTLELSRREQDRV